MGFSSKNGRHVSSDCHEKSLRFMGNSVLPPPSTVGGCHGAEVEGAFLGISSSTAEKRGPKLVAPAVQSRPRFHLHVPSETLDTNQNLD